MPQIKVTMHSERTFDAALMDDYCAMLKKIGWPSEAVAKFRNGKVGQWITREGVDDVVSTAMWEILGDHT